MRRVAFFAFIVMLVAACARGPSPVMTGECVSGCREIAAPAPLASTAPNAFAVQQMPAPLHTAMAVAADSTSAFTFELIQSVDAAVEQVLGAGRLASIGAARPEVRRARSSLESAGSHAAAVIRQGDRINEIVTALPTAANRPWTTGDEFATYWSRARHQLVLARNSAGQGVDAADAALECGTITCARPRIATLRQRSEETSGATYMAEPLVRISMVYARSKFGTGL